jgi:hypothetical protein
MERYYYSPPWINGPQLSTSTIATYQNRKRITTNYYEHKMTLQQHHDCGGVFGSGAGARKCMKPNE